MHCNDAHLPIQLFVLEQPGSLEQPSLASRGTMEPCAGVEEFNYNSCVYKENTWWLLHVASQPNAGYMMSTFVYHLTLGKI